MSRPDEPRDDYYELLGVGAQATQSEITQAYRQRARQVHPDVHPEDAAAEEQFKLLGEAHAVLSDPDKRRAYDRRQGRTAGRPRVARASARARGPVDHPEPHVRLDSQQPDQVFSGSAGVPFSPSGSLFADLLADVLGSSATWPCGPETARRGRDVEAVLTLSPAEARYGVTVSFALPGRGELRLRIPPGVRSGDRFRLSGEGESGMAGGPSGDLFVDVRTQPPVAPPRPWPPWS